MRPLLVLLVAMPLMACESSAMPPPIAQTAPSVTASAATPSTARLTVITGGGNITSTPPGIDCRSESPPWKGTGACSADFPGGTAVTLHFVPTMAAGFAQFNVTQPGEDVSKGTVQSGDHCDVQLDGDRTVRVAAVTIPPPPPGPH
jgi:hypothetical protein